MDAETIGLWLSFSLKVTVGVFVGGMLLAWLADSCIGLATDFLAAYRSGRE